MQRSGALISEKKRIAYKKFLLCISRVLSGIVFFFVLFFSVILIAQRCGVEINTVISPSMAPEIPVGSLVISVPTEFSEIVPGDDITYRIGSSLVTHRVVGTDPSAQLLYTQGIANRIPDRAVTASQIAGRVAFHLPLIGYAFLFLSTVQGKITLTVIFEALVIIALLLEKAADKYRCKERETNSSGSF